MNLTTAAVRLWGRNIGAVSWQPEKGFAFFEYEADFVKSHIQLSPIKMPLSNQVYFFPDLKNPSFHGLPGLLADSLPDKFGHLLIDQYLQLQGRRPESFNPVERLCYIGKRGVGALEFEPVQGPNSNESHVLELDLLVELAGKILTERDGFKTSLSDSKKETVMQDILRVGTSAGGARAKALVAWNPETGEVRSGQVDAGKGFSYWLLKFDGVQGNKDKELEDPKGYGLIEYAYYKMALAAGIRMTESRILKENDRAHFMTRRFDRTEQGKKIHMQSLGALAHYDFNQAGAYSYEQVFEVMRLLGLSMDALEEQYRRMIFNILARNQDDHVKNIAFLMDKTGVWSLSPAFDMTYSYNPSGDWTNQHQMTVNGKRNDFVRSDFLACAETVSLNKSRVQHIFEEVQQAVKTWLTFAEEARVPEEIAQHIADNHRYF